MDTKIVPDLVGKVFVSSSATTFVSKGHKSEEAKTVGKHFVKLNLASNTLQHSDDKSVPPGLTIWLPRPVGEGEAVHVVKMSKSGNSAYGHVVSKTKIHKVRSAT